MGLGLYRFQGEVIDTQATFHSVVANSLYTTATYTPYLHSPSSQVPEAQTLKRYWVEEGN